LSSFRNEEFYVHYKNVVKSLLERLNEIPTEQLSFLYRNKERFLLEIPEFKSCVDYMKDDPDIAKNFTPQVFSVRVAFIHGPEDFLIILAYDCFRAKKSAEFDEEIFKSIYKPNENFLYADYITFKVFGLLEIFISESEEITLEEDVKIRKITREELQSLFMEEQEESLNMAIYEPIPLVTHIVELTLRTEKFSGSTRAPPKFEEQQLLDNIVTTLRIFKAGSLGINVIRYTPETISQWLMPSTGRTLYERCYFLGTTYSLQETEVWDFKNFWKAVRRIDFSKRGFLRIAFERFNDSRLREKEEDQLIDMIIAFEAFLSKDEEQQELRYRLSLRTASLLGKMPEEKRRIFSEMKKAYDIRSKIVHERNRFMKLKLEQSKYLFHSSWLELKTILDNQLDFS
jgi:hypothetical protein